ncbi:hypothetical protein [Methylobacterium trifolii]|uniref:Sigma-like protein n=1 Tax=Methylobacterium trifolii TaxID=1003092 RepID=A0ABQ4U3S0_9HYPH|nr:hypothetical protein [Methylobacterium trifolii]GJE61668.1 hypothetical protein MPOCJGCO_3791 [Methylobacterium trifolii]
MSDEPRTDETPPAKKPANAAPDAVMDPNEKTEGHPGMGPEGKPSKEKDTDPGGG